MAICQKIFSLLLLFVVSTLSAEDRIYTLPEPKTQEEALFLRRISEFWGEGEYEIVQQQILEFIKAFPQSTFISILSGISGDLQLRGKNYKEAILHYDNIKDEKLQKEFFINKMQCYRELNAYPVIAKECEANLVHFANDDPKVYNKILYFLAEGLYYEVLKLPESSPERQALAKITKSRFESIKDPELSKEAVPPLAYLYHILGETERAAESYFQLAQNNTPKKEEMLFKAGVLQACYNKEKAIQTFLQVCNMGKSKAPESAFNRIALLFELKQYPEVLLAKDQYQSIIPKEKIPLIHFFSGSSHYFLGDHKRAYNELLEFIQSGKSEEEEFSHGLFTLLDSICKLEDPFLFDPLLQNGGKIPKSLLAEVYFSKAMLDKRMKKESIAKEDFAYLDENFPEFLNRESFLYEYAHLLYSQKEWEKCRVKFKEFLTHYPNSLFAPLAWRYFINSSIENGNANNEAEAKKLLAVDLRLVLQQNELLTEKEKDDLSFTLAKACYEIEDYNTAIELVDKQLKDTPASPLSPDLYLLLAYSFQKGKQDLEQFCRFAEKALDLNANLQNRESIRLGLYNAYLQLGERNAQRDYWDKAAEHLFQAAFSGSQIQEANLAWLSGFYYAKVKKFSEENWQNKLKISPVMDEFAKRAIFLLEKRKSAMLANNKMPIVELLKLKDLFELKEDYLSEEQTIESLKNFSKESIPDEYKKEILFAEAKFAVKKKDISKALILFEEIIEKPFKDFISIYSTLQSARLHFENVKNEPELKTHPEFIAAVSLLKDLIIQRTFAYEPMHLEAALEYAEIISSAENSPEKEETRISILSKAVQDFESEEDILSKNYQNARKNMPEKENLSRAYLDLMDAEILIAKSRLAVFNKNNADATKYSQEATKILRILEKYPVTAYLYNRVQKNLEILSSNYTQMNSKG
ncbi:MAG TPA: hypothetical protein VLG44_05695 [Chlamydiales bacterium]|nr:hypothetical protein [Chlamydiales bacterium]